MFFEQVLRSEDIHSVTSFNVYRGLLYIIVFGTHIIEILSYFILINNNKGVLKIYNPPYLEFHVQHRRTLVILGYQNL